MVVFSGSKYCHTLLETVGLYVPNDNFRDFNLFNVDYKGQTCPPAQCTFAENAIDNDIDIFSGCLADIFYFYYFIQKLSKPLIL